MKEIDTHGKPDGKISLEEFKSWWMREFSYTGALDMLKKNLTRMWLKVHSALTYSRLLLLLLRLLLLPFPAMEEH